MRCRLRVLICLVTTAIAVGCSGPAAPNSGASTAASAAPEGAGSIRFTGLLEAVRSRTITVPRLAGTVTPMIITFLSRPGTRVKNGDRVLAFDQQEQQRLANDKRAEVVDLESQIDRKKAEQAAAEAKDQTGIIAAENDVERAKLAVATNDLLARVAAEKNSLTLEQNIAGNVQAEEGSRRGRSQDSGDSTRARTTRADLRRRKRLEDGGPCAFPRPHRRQDDI